MAGAVGRSRDESRSNSLSGPSADAWVGANELERDEVAAYLALAQVPGIGAAAAHASRRVRECLGGAARPARRDRRAARLQPRRRHGDPRLLPAGGPSDP